MGSILIIKGADFSKVAADKVLIPKVIADISDRYTIQDGYFINMSGNVSTTSVLPFSRFKKFDISEYAGKKLLVYMPHYNNPSGTQNAYAAFVFETASGINSDYSIRMPQYSDDSSILSTGELRLVTIDIPSDAISMMGTYPSTTSDWYKPAICKVIE